MIGAPFRIIGKICVSFAVVALLHAHAHARSDIGTPRLMQGPMLGAVGPNGILVWARVSGQFPVTVLYGTDAALEDPAVAGPITASPEEDFAVVVPIEDLEPDTQYFYRVQINGRDDRYGKGPTESFRTAPALGQPAKFRMAFGSCARIQVDREQAIWDTVSALEPDFFVWTGDNIYGDSLEPEILAEEYRRQFNVASLEPVLRTVPQLAIWDDHDYGLNDHDRTHPRKEEALEVFRTYWANPAYGLPNAPGCFFHWHYGGVDFFFLDIRYYRDPNADPDTPGKTMLGDIQMEWLKNGLANSDTPFKVLISGSGWTKAKGPGGDAWSSYLHERDRLFDYIRDNEIGGVVLVSGDTHCGELNAIPWSEHGGYDFYDLVSSPLAQSGSTGWQRREPEVRLRPGFSAPNAGLIEFDLTGAEPTLTFNNYDEDGNAVWNPLTLSASDLQNGVNSHQHHIEFDPDE